MNSLLGGYTNIFTRAWKTETYEGVDTYPDYYWWSQEPEYAWLSPGVGAVKWVRNSGSLGLMQFVREDEVLELSTNSNGASKRIAAGGLVVVQLRGTDPTSPNSLQWRLAEGSGTKPSNASEGLLEVDGNRAFYSDIDSANSPLVSGTYVFRFRATGPGGLATLRFERQGPAVDDSPDEISWSISIVEP